jgi:tRNA A22 N-methylase
LALEAFSVLARQGRSWRRLGHLVDMAVTDYYGRDDIRTIADVGTDHGLLAMGLALSERFDKVVGVDVSQRALQDGALSLLENVQKYNYLEEQKKNKAKGLLEIPIEFRFSNGLENVDQADAVCIAGMGVHTMLRILESSFSSTEEGMLLDVDRIGCQKLLLQPTNSRPRHLILLYDTLQESGWCLVDERIEKLSSRWYISSCFMRSNRHRQENEDEVALPLSKLSSTLGESDSSSMRQVFEEYLQHHLHWIHQDAKAGGGATNEADQRWLARFGE